MILSAEDVFRPGSFPEYTYVSRKSKKSQAIREHLSKLQELLSNKEDIFKVIDWKDGSFYILDPLFLFYLRRGGANNV